MPNLKTAAERINLADPPVLMTIGELTKSGPWSRATIYRLLRGGQLTARKLAGRTVIDGASLRAFIENAPAATFRPL